MDQRKHCLDRFGPGLPEILAHIPYYFRSPNRLIKERYRLRSLLRK